MADENTGLVVIDIKPESYPTLYVTNGLDKYLNQIRQAVNEVPDVTTAKGRARIASLAASASRSKTAIEKPGREYLKKLKEAVKPAEAEIKRFVDACDALRDETRRPLTEWEAEQDRLKQEAEAKKKAEELAAEIEVAHEMALLMNDAFDRDAKAKADEIERLRKAHEEFIAQQAAEKAKREVEEKAKRDIEAAEQREREAKLAQERAEQKAEQDKKDAAAKAEREKQDAIAAEKLKAQEEAERVQREAKQKEDARLAEEKRVADEAAKRAADVEHRRTINRQAVADLIANGLPEDCAQKCVAAIAKNLISSVRITY
ncbi:TPA: hypothetical protein ACPZN0_004559 [Yersinia enterocolitica]|uniref:hypothetical protein n=1 Tax=Yersinia enterocolitica TaxID=630 RepID=UPI0021B5210D|nr:hypothetical protein [Yersinia enterocolitica]ELI8051612.1 hypothetical protein [Yersinia enterocolitica]UXD30555.1 TolA protein [Yersinia enterocolitica]HEN3491627.1 hypothetical protein [Yersinia enterocolitica]